jgi:hypothetical protein
MKSNWLIVTLVLLLFASVAVAQDETHRPIILQLADGGFVGFKSETAWAEANGPAPTMQPTQGDFTTQAFIDENHIVHRLLLDSSRKYIFGYDVVIAAVPAQKKFSVTVKRLDPTVETQLARATNGPVGRIATLPQSTEQQILDDGDSLALDLLVNQKAGVKIVDLVKFSYERANLWQDGPFAPRDFTPDAVALAISDFRLLVNGNLIAKGQPAATFSGGLIWCYVEEQGRFIFSLVPREGYQFQKIGIIQDNRIEFTFKGKRYEWLSSASIVPGGGAWNLWMLHDPKYVPFGLQEVRKEDKSALDKLDDSIQAAANKATKISDPKSADYGRQAAANSQAPPTPKRVRVMVGAADRMENLLPR